MNQAAVALLVIGRPLAVLGTVALPAVAVARRALPRAGVALWVVALVLLAVWGVATYRAALEAGPADVSPLDTVGWLGLAVAAALGSLLLAHRSRATAG
jgi:hypothetical protein